MKCTVNVGIYHDTFTDDCALHETICNEGSTTKSAIVIFYESITNNLKALLDFNDRQTDRQTNANILKQTYSVRQKGTERRKKN